MKLFYTPGACSLASHIALREAGLNFDLEKVDLGAKKTQSGGDYTKVNPNGYVPALQLGDGEVLTEGPAILQYIADQKPAAKLAPASGSMDRYRLQSWLNFITAEIHKGFSPLFNSATPEAYRPMVIEKLGQRIQRVADHLSKNSYLTGDSFSIADAYLFTVLSWAKHVGLDLSKWPTVQNYLARIAERPSVGAALKAEGLA